MLFARGTWSRAMIGFRPTARRRRSAGGPLLPRDRGRRGRSSARRLVTVDLCSGAARRRSGPSSTSTSWRRPATGSPSLGRRELGLDVAPPGAAAAPRRGASSCTGGGGCRRRAASRPARRRAPPQDHRRVADVVAEREVVRDEEDPEAARLQVAEQVQDVDPRRGIEHADDLVGDEQPDVEQERAGDQQALELAAAQLVRVLAEDVAGVEAHGVQRPSSFACHSESLSPEKYSGAEHREDAIRLEDRVVRAERVLEDALDVGVVLLERPPWSVAMSTPSNVMVPRVPGGAGGSSSRSSTSRCRSRR